MILAIWFNTATSSSKTVKILTLLLLAACDSAPQIKRDLTVLNSPESATPLALPQQPQVLISLYAGLADTNFALVSNACVGQQCGSRVALIERGYQLHSLPVALAASNANVIQDSEDPHFSINQKLTSFTAGEEEGAVTTAIQTVHLSDRRIGLLVHQAGGFEHVKRNRVLYIADKKKLVKVWERRDGEGPVISYADVIHREGQDDQIILVEGGSFDPTEPDQVKAQRLDWDERSLRLRSVPIGLMTAVVFGNFKSIESARAVSATVAHCYSNYWLVRGAQVGERNKNFVWVELVPNSLVASESGKRERECLKSELKTKSFRF